MDRACQVSLKLEMRNMLQLNQLTDNFIQYETLQLKIKGFVQLRQLTGFFLQYETLPWKCLSRLAARIAKSVSEDQTTSAVKSL